MSYRSILILTCCLLGFGGCSIVGDTDLAEAGQGGGACAVPAPLAFDENGSVAGTRTQIPYRAPDLDGDGQPDERDVVTILGPEAQGGYGCTDSKCHGGRPTAGVNLFDLPDSIPVGAREGPILVPCKPEESPILSRISPACPNIAFDKMPPNSVGMFEGDVAIIQQWILEGARETYDPNACAPEPDADTVDDTGE